MFIKAVKIFTITFILSVFSAFSALAADSFPFIIEFDVNEISRLCYAGHSGGTVRYREGLAVTPDTWFSVTSVEQREKDRLFCEVSELSAEVSLIYENDTSDGSFTEVLKTYDEGSLDEGVAFQLLSDNNIANLRERDKLYSDQLKGMVLTLSARSGERVKKKNIYLYVCDYDDMDYFAESSANG